MALEFNFLSSGAIAAGTVLFSHDADMAQGLSLQVQALGAGGVVVVQQSNDAAQWVDVLCSSAGSGVSYSALPGVGLYYTNITARYCRVVLSSGVSSGTTQIVGRVCSDALPTVASSLKTNNRAVASDGTVLDLASLDMALVWNSDGTLNYSQVVQGAGTYRQTLSWSSGKVTNVSKWVKQ